VSALKANQNTVVKLRAEIAKHSHATVAGSPIFEATIETIVANPFRADLTEIREEDSSHPRERVMKELSFIRRGGLEIAYPRSEPITPICLLEWQRLPGWLL
jgi:hypothetical protein